MWLCPRRTMLLSNFEPNERRGKENAQRIFLPPRLYIPPLQKGYRQGKLVNNIIKRGNIPGSG